VARACRVAIHTPIGVGGAGGPCAYAPRWAGDGMTRVRWASGESLIRVYGFAGESLIGIYGFAGESLVGMFAADTEAGVYGSSVTIDKSNECERHVESPWGAGVRRVPGQKVRSAQDG
jgi:hypothetical protein